MKNYNYNKGQIRWGEGGEREREMNVHTRLKLVNNDMVSYT